MNTKLTDLLTKPFPSAAWYEVNAVLLKGIKMDKLFYSSSAANQLTLALNAHTSCAERAMDTWQFLYEDEEAGHIANALAMIMQRVDALSEEQLKQLEELK